MIRINLLGVPKAKRGKRAAVPAMAGEGPSMMAVGLVVVLLVLVGNGGYWFMLNREATGIAGKMREAEAENRRLAQVKVRFEERDKQRESYQKRLEVIDKLKQAQSGPVNLLTMIGDTVNATDAVWLNKMNDDGNNISIEGTALSNHAVANLLQNLKKTGFFKNVEIKESYQDDTVKDMQAFTFTIVCEKQKS